MRPCRPLLLTVPLLLALATPAIAQGERTSPDNALRICKNAASARMPNVPRTAISVYLGTGPGNGGHMVRFRSQPRRGPPGSGFCNIAWNGALRNLQFDAPLRPQGRTPGGNATQNFGGKTPLAAMRSCKSTVSMRFPNVPLAFIEVDQPSVNGGSLLSNFRVKEPNGVRASGACDVFRNGKVNLSVR